jgi:glycosyltransferase involved in cell wall biosynthesis
MPLYSVVMPAYNTAPFVGPAIRSVLAQTCGNFELIVVDDGSTDDTAARIRPFEADPRIRVIHQPNRGLAAARNAGIECASGEYISFLDSDDLWMPNYLEAMAGAFRADRDAGLAYTDAWVLDDARRVIFRATAMSSVQPPLVPPTDRHELLELLLRGNFVFSSATARRAALETAGHFDTRLAAAEDWEMWFRVVANGYRLVRPPGLHAIYRWRHGSLSKREVFFLTNIRRFLQLVVEEYDVPEDIRALAHRRLRQLDSDLSVWGRRRAALRRRAGALRRFVVGRKNFFDTPPREVSMAFPDLTAL